jgi:hypothetical protein
MASIAASLAWRLHLWLSTGWRRSLSRVVSGLVEECGMSLERLDLPLANSVVLMLFAPHGSRCEVIKVRSGRLYNSSRWPGRKVPIEAHFKVWLLGGLLALSYVNCSSQSQEPVEHGYYSKRCHSFKQA